MNFKEISEFVNINYPVTFTNSRTEIKFWNNDSIYGYFDSKNEKNRTVNIWDFIQFSQGDVPQNATTINGDDIKSIHLHLQKD